LCGREISIQVRNEMARKPRRGVLFLGPDVEMGTANFYNGKISRYEKTIEKNQKERKKYVENHSKTTGLK